MKKKFSKYFAPISKPLNNCNYMIKKLWKFKKALVINGFVTNILARVVTIVGTVLIPKLVYDAMEQRWNMASFVMMVLGYVALQCIVRSREYWLDFIYNPIKYKLFKTHMTRSLYEKSTQMDLLYFDDPEFYNEYILSLRSAESVPFRVMDIYISFLGAIIGATSLTTYVAALDPLLLCCVAAGILLSLVLSFISNKLSFRSEVENNVLQREISYVARVMYLPEYNTDLKVTEIGEVLFSKYKDCLKKLMSIIKYYGKRNLYIFVSSEGGNFILLTILPLIYIIFNIFSGQAYSIGDIVAVTTATATLCGMVTEIFIIIPKMQKQSLFIEKLRHFMDMTPRIINPENPLPLHASIETIEFRNVSFSYPKQSPEDGLQNLSFQINKGESISLVGQNGAGKTTIIKLLLRLYEPSGGSILVNGHDIKNYGLSDYRNLFSIVYQDFQVLSISIAENVLMRTIDDPDKDERLVWDALEKSGLADKVRSLPNQIYTIIGREFDDNGVILSKGEIQKLMLARVYAKQSPIIVLDEPSSSLDPIAEYEMHEAMLRAAGDKLVIFVSHRLSNTILSDKILVLQNGCITEQGNHKKLMEQHGTYRELFEAQARYYK